MKNLLPEAPIGLIFALIFFGSGYFLAAAQPDYFIGYHLGAVVAAYCIYRLIKKFKTP